MIRVTVWNEFYHEKNDPRTAAVYPDGFAAGPSAPSWPRLSSRTRTSPFAPPRWMIPSAA